MWEEKEEKKKMSGGKNRHLVKTWEKKKGKSGVRMTPATELVSIPLSKFLLK